MDTNVREYRHIDKSAWGDGESQREPDKRQWIDEATGLDCLAVRHSQSGHWCGYVGIAEGHPFFEVGYDECRVQCEQNRDEGYCDWDNDHTPNRVVRVHGGLTYADFCREGAEETGVCHIPFDGRPARIWWLGFDCAHCDDVSPSMRQYLPDTPNSVYRTLDYVQSQCADLAQQLALVNR
jgi:hypothetical protein